VPPHPGPHGGSAHRRIIGMLVEFWDRVSLKEQENMIGRRRDTGAALESTKEFGALRYDEDTDGSVIPTDADNRIAKQYKSVSTARRSRTT
jgi:deferrochelatase/peroxidase EfeB